MHCTRSQRTQLQLALSLIATSVVSMGCATTSGTCPAVAEAPAAEAAPAPTAESAPAPLAADAQTTALEVPMAEGEQQRVVRVDETPWGACPPNLPKPCEMAVLEGNPRERTLFTVRFRVPAEFVMAPHTHPRAERVTVISGKVGVGFGSDSDRSKGKVFGPGDHYINAPDAVHYVWTEEPTVIQIHGIGPWVATPIAPAGQ